VGFRARLLLLLSMMFLSLFCGSAFSAQENFPQPRGAVNDFAGVIEESYAKRMESLSREIWEKTRTSIVVAVMASIGDNDPADYANRLYQAWGIGEKGKDKGVLILLALKERKVRIETGYGVEGILPDGLVGEIIDRYMLPHLRNGEYGKGLANGLIAVASIVAKDAHVAISGAPERSEPQRMTRRRVTGLLPVILILALIPLLGTRRGRELLPFLLIMLMGSGRGGGGYGGGFGGSSGGGGGGRSF